MELTKRQKEIAISYVMDCIKQELKADKVVCKEHGTSVSQAVCILADKKTRRGHIVTDAGKICCPSFELITELYLKKPNVKII